MNRRALLGSWSSTLVILGIIVLVASLAITSTMVMAQGSAPSTPATNPARRTGGGSTVWDGVYAQGQAKRGQVMYARQCASCHKDDLRGEDCAPALIGEAFWARWKDVPLGEMYERIRTTMPVGSPGWFSPPEYAEVVSYLLSANGLPAGQRELPTDQATLGRIAILEKAPH